MNIVELITALHSGGYLKGTWSSAKDETYQSFSVEFIQEAMGSWLSWLPPELVTVRDVGGGKTVQVPRWETESGDCDNIAYTFCAYLTVCAWLDAVKTSRPRGNAAAGSFFFYQIPGDLSSGHAIVWWVDHSGRAHHCDPATRAIDHLSQAQLATIFGGDYA